MSSVTQATRALEDVTVPVKLKLAALWTVTMFLFAYGDIFAVYRAEKVREILGGEIAGIEVTQTFLVAAGVYVAIPSVMVFLSLALRARVNRRTNLAVGAVYAPTIIASAIGEGWRTPSSSVSWRLRARPADRVVRVELAPPAGGGVGGAGDAANSPLTTVDADVAVNGAHWRARGVGAPGSTASDHDDGPCGIAAASPGSQRRSPCARRRRPESSRSPHRRRERTRQ